MSVSTPKGMLGFHEIMAKLEISFFKPSNALMEEEGKGNLVIFTSKCIFSEKGGVHRRIVGKHTQCKAAMVLGISRSSSDFS